MRSTRISSSKTVFLGYAKPATGPVPQNDKQFYTADVPTYPFDVAKANALLDEAGYKRGGDGTRFKLKLLPAPYFNETKQFGDYLRQALARDRHRRRDRQQRRGRAPEGRLHRPCLRPRGGAAGVPRRPGDLDHHPRAERHPRRRALLQPGRLRQCRTGRADRQGGGDARRGQAHASSTRISRNSSPPTCR